MKLAVRLLVLPLLAVSLTGAEPPVREPEAQAILAEAQEKSKALVDHYDRRIEGLKTQNANILSELAKLREQLDANKPFSMLIDCGSFIPWNDPMGNAWLADPISDGRISLAPSAVTLPGEDKLETLYRTERIGAKLTYPLNVPPGNYRVTLRFRESYYSAVGKRVFSVTINGVVTEQALDIFAVTGGKNIPLLRTTQTTVGEDRKLVVEFNKGAADIPSICALSVERIP